ncbi:MAG: hypothetical protein WC326_13015 [Candidatus Delongbacteria bacterium]
MTNETNTGNNLKTQSLTWLIDTWEYTMNDPSNTELAISISTELKRRNVAAFTRWIHCRTIRSPRSFFLPTAE